MYLDEYVVGQSFDVPAVEINEEKMVAFAREYDPFAIHCDKEYAQTTPFGRLIAPGVMSFMTVWAQFVKLGVLNDGLIAGKRTKMEWFTPVYAGDVLMAKATVTDITRKNSRRGMVEITMDIFNQSGERVIRNVTEAIVQAKP